MLFQADPFSLSQVQRHSVSSGLFEPCGEGEFNLAFEDVPDPFDVFPAGVREHTLRILLDDALRC